LLGKENLVKKEEIFDVRLKESWFFRHSNKTDCGFFATGPAKESFYEFIL